jgi:hypothetical protein
MKSDGMLRRQSLLALLATVLGVLPADTWACGDKFLVIGRSVKRVPKARHPAAIVLDERPGSALARVAKEMKLEATLRQAGHDVTSVTQGGSLRALLAARRYDFVLVDLPGADAVALEIEGSGPELVPVANKTSEEALRAAQREHAVVIKAGKGFAYLAALDESMARRARTGASQ